ncbi:DNA repair protein RadA [Myxococcota bacterium]|nr:DNA repair protein RadA [Myxococcota bacterium]
MAKTRTVFCCQSCGHSAPKWMGRCPACEAWGTMEEEVEAPKSSAGGKGRGAFGAITNSKPQRLNDIAESSIQRNSTGIGELDRVLGGGLVRGALVLVGGDPGIGKSTLMLQAADKIGLLGGRVLYVTGEESPAQTKMRAVRLGATAEELFLVAETSMERVEQHVAEIKPQVLVIDSVQTLFTESATSTPGSVSQLRAVTARLMVLAKGLEISTFLVGHVTKDGSIAGPRVLEHMVDTVLYFQGQRGHAFRVLRAIKNRFGSTNEIGAFEMQGKGLVEIKNPSALFLAERLAGASGSVVVASFEGTRPILVEVQALVSPTPYGTPRRTTMGVDSGRVALLLAVLEKKAGLDVGASDTFVNVAGGMRLDEPAVDLAVVAALASSHIDRPVDAETLVFGEVGLGGEVRAVVAADARIAEARQLGFKRVIMPKNNLKPEEAIEGILVVGVEKVEEMLDALF